MKDWSRVRLRHVCDINPPTAELAAISSDEPITFLPLEAIWPDALNTSSERPKRELESGYTRFREGDVLVPKITPTFEASRSAVAAGLRNGVGCGTTELHVLRARPPLDRRFLFYVTHSHRFLAEGASAMQGVAGQKRVPESVIADHVIGLPSLEEQRRLAGFLGRETARIDRLAERKRLLVSLLESRRRALVDALIRRTRSESLRVRHLVGSITSGPRGWSDYYSESGHAFLRMANVTRYSVDLDLRSIVYVAAPAGPEAERTRTAPGDVLLSITADIGSVAVVPADFGHAYISQHLALLRPRRELVEPYWLGLCLFASEAQGQLDSARYGGTKTQLSLEDVTEVRLPVPPLDVQRGVLSEWKTIEGATDDALRRLQHQLGLIREHRQALITAAVTGELDIPERAA